MRSRLLGSAILGIALGWMGCHGSRPTRTELAEDTRWAILRSITPLSHPAVRMNGPIQVDGRMDEPAWQELPWSAPFVNIEGPDHPPPHLQTRFKIGWDDSNLYVGALMRETAIWGVRTDSTKPVWQDPDFEIFIDPDGDHHDYFEFQINVLETTNEIHFPRAYGDAGRSDRRAWFPGLAAAVHAEGTPNYRYDEDSYWSTEVALPWSGFTRYQTDGKPPEPGDIWRMNFSRVHWNTGPDSSSDGYVKLPGQRSGTNWSWTPQGIVLMHIPEMWGYIQFVESLASWKPPEPDPARDCLLDTYYRQRRFNTDTGSWALDLGRLFTDRDLRSRCPQLRLDADTSGFIATYEDGNGNASIDHRRHFNRPAIRERSRDLR